MNSIFSKYPHHFLLLAVGVCLGDSAVYSQVWNGGSGDDHWSSAANWDGGVAPVPSGSTDISFGGATRLTPDNDFTAFSDFHNILFNSGAGSFTISGNAIDLFGKLENNSSVAQNFNLAIGTGSVSGGFIEINPTQGDLNIGGTDVFLGNNQLRVWGNNGKTLTFGPSTIISGAGGTLAINQNSTVVFQSAHTYTGATFINTGILRVASGGSANSSTINLLDTAGSLSAALELAPLAGGLSLSSPLVVRSGSSGVASLNSLNTSGTNTLSGGLTLNKDLSITTAAGGTLAISGVVGGGSGLTKLGDGILLMTGANTYTGATTISAGTLKLQGTAFSTSPRSYVIASGAVLNVDGNSGVALGTTSLSGAGTWRITGGVVGNEGPNTPAGSGRNITVGMASGGLIDIQAGGKLINGGWANMTWTGNQAGLKVDGTFDLWDGQLVTVDALTGSGIVNANPGSGGGQTIAVGAAGGSGTFTGAIQNANRTVALTKLGAGTQTLTGLNTYTGGTTISGGTLEIAGSGQLGGGSYATAISNAGTLLINSTANQTLSGIISGVGTLVKGNSGTLTISAVNTYSGGTTVNGGRLIVVNNKTGSSNFVTNADLEFNITTGTQQFNGGTFSGTGNIIKTGAGDMWLGANGSPQIIALTGTNSVIDVQGGVLRNEYLNTGWTNNKAGLNVASGATFNVWDGNVTADELTGAGTIDKGQANTHTLTVGVLDGTGTFSGIIKNALGTTNFVKQGIGTQTLTGVNTFTGTTTITAGTLEIGGAGQIGNGTYAPAISNAGTLLINSSASQTLSGIISGTGSLVKSNSGTLTLSGVNTFTGGLVIKQGTVIAATSASTLGGTTGAVTLGDTTGANAATLRIGTSALTFANPITLATNPTSGTLTIGNTGTAVSTTFTGGITGSNHFTINSNATTGTITFSGSAINNVGTITNAGTSVTGNILTTGAGIPQGGVAIANAVGANVTAIIQNGPSDLVLSANNTAANFTTTINNGRLNISNYSAGLSAPWNPSLGVSIAASSGNSAILNYAGAMVNSAGSVATVAGPINVSGAGTNYITVTDWNPTFSGLITLGANLTFATLNNNGSAITLTGGTTGTGNITVSNNLPHNSNRVVFNTAAVNHNGTLTFNNAATLGGTAGTGTGVNTISGGVGSNVTAISQDSPSNPLLINTTALTVNAAGTTLNAGGTAAFNITGGITGTGNLILNTNNNTAGITISTTAVNNNGIISNTGTGTATTLISAAITNAGASVVQNSASSPMTLSGANTYTGSTTVTAGLLKIQTVAFSTTPRSYSVASGAVLNIDGNTGLATGTSTISGAGTLRVTGGAFGNEAPNTVVGAGRNLVVSLGAGSMIDIQSGARMINGGWANTTWTSNLSGMNVNGSFDMWDGTAVTIDALTGSGVVNKGQNGSTAPLNVGVNNGSGEFSGTLLAASPNGATLYALNKLGSGTQTISGTADNVSLAANVTAGTLVLAKTSSATVHALGILSTVSGGTLRLGGTGNDQIYDNVGLTVNSGSFDLNGMAETIRFLSGSGGTVNNATGTLSTLTVNLTNAGTFTYSGVINGNTRLVVSNSTTKNTDVQALNGTNGFTGGILIDNGHLRVTSDAALGAVPGTFEAANITLQNGGVLQNFDSTPVLHANRGITLGTGGGILYAGWNKTLTIEGEISGAGSLTKTDNGQVVLNGVNTYTGATNILSSVLVLSGGGRLSDATAVNLAAAGSSLSISGITGTGVEKVGSLTGVTGSTLVVGAKTLEFGDGANTTFGGAIDSSAGGGLKKSGSGIFTLGSTTTFNNSPNIDISGGTLLTTSNNLIPNGSAFTLSGGTLATGGFSDTVGSLTVTNSSVIDLGTSGGTAVWTFANSASTTWSGTLAVWNWSGNAAGLGADQLYFGAGGLTTDQLASISFVDPAGFAPGTYPAGLLGTGELVPVPEPGAFFFGTVLLGMAGFRRRRRKMSPSYQI